ncbi:hypothetical protein ILUMI_17642 [Ignelater luminosus]|uniref:PiggyBac transposable element-derived protein domain-containing protein n=1 Tax=Ignelater luminosus TaxID=2038154 RepID=A0A8K0CMX2_IGNLU|nr:hypothetical protein ILUMI_17642 [Ignelater luminosus]
MIFAESDDEIFIPSDEDSTSSVDSESDSELNECIADITVSSTTQWFEITRDHQQIFNFLDASGIISNIPVDAVDCFMLFLSDNIVQHVVTNKSQRLAGKTETGGKVLATHALLNLRKDYLESGRILITGNFYTNIPLAHELLRRKTHSLGIIKRPGKGISKEIVTTKLSKGQVTCKEDEKGLMIAKWIDKKDVLILSTHHTSEIVNTGKKNKKQEEFFKSQFVVDYNYVNLYDGSTN